MSELNDKLLEIKRQKDTYILPENLKKDVTVYGVTGTLEAGSGDVKLFDTIEHMQQDETAQEGDLAIVYREEIQPVTGDSEFSSCIFPNEVVLDEAFTGNISGSFRSTDGGWFDGMVDLSSSSFRFDGFGDKMIRVEYTSQDGITYTRTDGGEELQEFGTTIKWGNYEPWNSVLGNFIKASAVMYDGFFQYTLDNEDLSKFWLLNLSDVIITSGSDPTSSFTHKFEYNSQELVDIIDGFAKMSSMYEARGYNNMSVGIYRGTDGNIYSIIPSGIEPSYYIVDFLPYTDGTIGIYYDGSIPNYYEYLKYDVTTGQYSKLGEFNRSEDTTGYDTSFSSYYNRTVYKIKSNLLVPASSAIICCYGDSYRGGSPYLYIYDKMGLRIIDFDSVQDKYICYGINLPMYATSFRRYNAYIIAPSQLNLDNANQLLPNKIAFGSNGVITGDGSIYNSLDTKEYYDTVLQTQLNTIGKMIITKNSIGSPAYLSSVTNGGACILEYQKNILPNNDVEYYFPTVFKYNNGYVICYRLRNSTSFYVDIYDNSFNIVQTNELQNSNFIWLDSCVKLHLIDGNLYIPCKGDTGSGNYIIKIENNIASLITLNTDRTGEYYIIDDDIKCYVCVTTSGIYMYDLSGNVVYSDTTTYLGGYNERNYIVSDTNYIYIRTDNSSAVFYSKLYIIDKANKTFVSCRNISSIVESGIDVNNGDFVKDCVENTDGYYLLEEKKNTNKFSVYKLNGEVKTKQAEFSVSIKDYTHNSNLFNYINENTPYIINTNWYEIYSLTGFDVIYQNTIINVSNSEDTNSRFNFDSVLYGPRLYKDGNNYIGYSLMTNGDLYKVILATKNLVTNNNGDILIPYIKSNAIQNNIWFTVGK